MMSNIKINGNKHQSMLKYLSLCPVMQNDRYVSDEFQRLKPVYLRYTVNHVDKKILFCFPCKRSDEMMI